MAGQGISGVGVAVAAVGGLLVYAGIVDAPLLDAVREITAGRTPAGRAAKPTPVTWRNTLTETGGRNTFTDGTGSAVVAAARKYLGRPYRWGATGPEAFDCSGLVWRALNEAGIKHNRLTSYGYRSWRNAYDIPRAQASAGDLVCYTGHIGICIGDGRMIHAPNVRTVVKESAIYNGQGGPIFRRVKGTNTGEVST